MSVQDWMAAPADSGTAGPGREQAEVFVLVGDSITDEGTGPVASFDPRRANDVLIVELGGSNLTL
jgi:hypothetical protein